jgi:hypothetical protein
VQVDRKPTQARHLRMHGTDRRDNESGQFTGAGVYRLIGGYDKRGVPLARNYEPTVATDGACWYSVRAGERLVRRLLLDPHNAYPRAVTEAARQLMQIETPANTVAWACVLAAAGGDEAREVKLLLSASDGSWFVVSSQLPCDDCGERTEHRCLARLAAFEDGAGDQWLSVYRWALCLGGCCTDRPVQSLAPLTVALSAAKASKAVSCQPRLRAHGANSFVSHDSLLNLPIEVVYPAGLGVVDAQTGRCQLAERRVSPQDALTATTVTTLTRQLIACLPGASNLAPGAVVESRLKLSVAACTVTDPATGRESTNLWNGLKDVEWTIPVGAHGIELWASPCGGGKTYAAMQRMMRLLAPGELLLLIAPRVLLTEQLAQRVDWTASESQYVWHGKVRTYKCRQRERNGQHPSGCQHAGKFAANRLARLVCGRHHRRVLPCRALAPRQDGRESTLGGAQCAGANDCGRSSQYCDGSRHCCRRAAAGVACRGADAAQRQLETHQCA